MSKKKIGLKDITPENLKGFMQGNARFLSDTFGFTNYQEMVEYRIDKVFEKSPECLKGSCVHCGCATPQKFYEDRGCENGCYEDRATWLENKNKNI